MQRKSIIQGRLEFGSEKSFTQMLKMYEYRVENYYKHELLFKEEVFDHENFLINIPRLISVQEEKWWLNTVRLLDYLAEFSLSGSISAWLVHEGKILKYVVIEPTSEKAVVQNFLRGQKLAAIIGEEEAAVAALTKVIEKHDKHAQAYERRGFVNYIMGDMAGAIYDFNKSLSRDPSIPSAYYWRARVHMRKGNWNAALEDLDMTTRKAIALQPIYWKARRRKAQCYRELEDYAHMARELKLFTNRKFETDNPNYNYLRESLYRYAQAMIELANHEESLVLIDRALNLEDQEEYLPTEKLLTLRGLVRHALGEGGQDDWTRAAELGSEEAGKLLAEHPAN